MENRLLNPDRIVKVERKLRYPKDKKVTETMKSWLAQMLVPEFPKENNTASVRIKELDQE